jgi:GH15 family glucan-1,4-alpha-glucosidase
LSLPLEDYALLGDCHTAALVSRRGAIDWLCLPHFDSPACFAALLGTPDHGHWTICPAVPIKSVRRRYRGDTLVLETEYDTESGSVQVVDCMTPRNLMPDLVRLVVGKRGQVPMKMELVIRFDYGSVVPWVRRTKRGISAIAGPDMLSLRTDVPLRGKDLTTVAEFSVSKGQRVPFDLTWYPSNRHEPKQLDVEKEIRSTERWWQGWAKRCTYRGQWRDEVLRSLITLKALTFMPTGGIAAAPTTSLPEFIGGVRNWDYRFCWVRDSTLTLHALMNAGYVKEAAAWREWLLRAVAGRPSELNILYGLRGERRLTELELPWLPGYENSAPVRTGNAAYKQFQLDIFGEVVDTLYQCHRVGLKTLERAATGVLKSLIEFLEGAWKRPDEGIWEVRGPRQHFTHSKVMAWVAMDRAVKAVEHGWLSDHEGRWRALRQEIHEEICRQGFDSELKSFVGFYGSKKPDASLLMIPLVGFLPAKDPRMAGTVAAIEKHLMRRDGFVARYNPDSKVDGLPHGEGTFLACTFWLADNYMLQGRRKDAVRTFERLLGIRNDVGLLSEEYDPDGKRLVGNFPQGFSHIGLVNTAFLLAEGADLVEKRSG